MERSYKKSSATKNFTPVNATDSDSERHHVHTRSRARESRFSQAMGSMRMLRARGYVESIYGNLTDNKRKVCGSFTRMHLCVMSIIFFVLAMIVMIVVILCVTGFCVTIPVVNATGAFIQLKLKFTCKNVYWNIITKMSNKQLRVLFYHIAYKHKTHFCIFRKYITHIFSTDTVLHFRALLLRRKLYRYKGLL